MNKNIMNHIESKLEISKEENIKTLEALSNNMKNSTQQGISTSNSQVTNHPADIGTQLFEKELDLALINEQKDLSDKIDHAFERIDKGEFGICESCGSTIENQRLEILPYTSTCACCARQNPIEEQPRGDYVSKESLENFYDVYDELEEQGAYESQENLINIQSPDCIASGCVEKVEEISNEEYKNQL
ncbi:MAG: TraR/DksA C4-type zinc finger protein [Clostridium sp.]